MGITCCQQNRPAFVTDKRSSRSSFVLNYRHSTTKYQYNDISNYIPVQHLGKGLQGSSISVIFKQQTNKRFAQKITVKSRLNQSSLWVKKKQLEQQFLQINQVFVSIKKAFHIKNKSYIITQLFQGSLHSYLCYKKDIFSQLNLKIIGYEVLEVIDFLHEKNIIYGQLRPENVLVDNQQRIKLSQFLFAYKANQLSCYYGALQYTPPQVYLSDFYNQKIDVWQFGVFMYELATDSLPLTNQQIRKIEQKKQFNCFYKPLDEKYSSAFKSLISLCLEPNPEKRVTINQLIKHQFFKQKPFQNKIQTNKFKLCRSQAKRVLIKKNMKEVNHQISDI